MCRFSDPQAASLLSGVDGGEWALDMAESLDAKRGSGLVKGLVPWSNFIPRRLDSRQEDAPMCCAVAGVSGTRQATAITRGRLSHPGTSGSQVTARIQFQPCLFISFLSLLIPHYAAMSGCTLRFTRNSPLRTTLIDESTGHAKYQIDTPMTVARAITRIRKFEPHAHPPLYWHDDVDSDSGDDGGQEKQMSMEDVYETEGGDYAEAEAELPETSDEIAKIYWKWFATERMVFRGEVHLRNEFLPKCGKLKG